jgi:TusA-related sulfurtransferase
VNLDATLTLDTLGRRCPAPIIELARHLRDVEPGEVLAVLSDDAAAALDVPAWCELRGQEYLGSAAAERGVAYYVRRSQDAGAGSAGGGGGGN